MERRSDGRFRVRISRMAARAADRFSRPESQSVLFRKNNDSALSLFVRFSFASRSLLVRTTNESLYRIRVLRSTSLAHPGKEKYLPTRNAVDVSRIGNARKNSKILGRARSAAPATGCLFSFFFLLFFLFQHNRFSFSFGLTIMDTVTLSLSLSLSLSGKSLNRFFKRPHPKT